MEKTLLVSKLFGGNYVYGDENVVHETINFFRARIESIDEGPYLLYIPPDAKIRWRNYDVDTVLFVQHFGTGTVEVIGLAENVEPIDIPNKDTGTISYFGVSARTIFENNKYNGEKENDFCCPNAKTDCLKVPKEGKRILITFDEKRLREKYPDEDNVIICGLVKNSELKTIVARQKQFYNPKKWPDAYAKLKKLVERDDLFEDYDQTEGMGTTLDGSMKYWTPSFLEIIKRENDELVFSNLFKYFFEYSSNGFRCFTREVLEIEDYYDADYTVDRERNRIDLRIESKHHLIVIENKIDAKITNGQLKKYYKQAENDKVDGQNTHYYLFTPDYNPINPDNYPGGKEYTWIPYSSIFKFFRENSQIYIADKAFPEFLQGLQRHSVKTPAERTRAIMHNRFVKAISQVR